MTGGQRERLTAIGTALFGPTGWQRPFAAVLKVDDRLLRRWVSEERSVPATEWARIGALLSEQGREMIAAGRQRLHLAGECADLARSGGGADSGESVSRHRPFSEEGPR